jgi:hypothetical protein
VNVLFIGGSKASWQMRGRQMAAALGAHATVRPRQQDWEWADVVVLVKSAAETHWKDAAACGKPIVWDVVDVWMQPRDNAQPIPYHVARVQQMAQECGARLLIGATEAMAQDIGGAYLPHHARLDVTPMPPKAEPTTVAYDGSARYLGTWQPALERACEKVGLRFVVNPPSLADADVLVAFRDAEWDGEVCRRWKSGVKYVNALEAGRPILTQPCAAFEEIAPVGFAFEDQRELEDRLAMLCLRELRHDAYETGRVRAPHFTVDAMARMYRALLAPVVRRPS